MPRKRKRRNSKSKTTSREDYLNTSFRAFLKSIVRKLIWFLFVPVFTILSYYTQVRPYFLTMHGEYVTGLVDGAFSMVCLIIIALWLVSEVMPD